MYMMRFIFLLLIGLLPVISFADEHLQKDYGALALARCAVSQEQLIEKIQELQDQIRALREQGKAADAPEKK